MAVRLNRNCNMSSGNLICLSGILFPVAYMWARKWKGKNAGINLHCTSYTENTVPFLQANHKVKIGK